MNPVVKFKYIDGNIDEKLFGIFSKDQKVIIPYEYDFIRFLKDISNKNKCYFETRKNGICRIISIEKINSRLEIKEESLSELVGKSKS